MKTFPTGLPFNIKRYLKSQVYVDKPRAVIVRAIKSSIMIYYEMSRNILELEYCLRKVGIQLQDMIF